MLSDVIGFYKRNKREDSDQILQFKNIENLVSSIKPELKEFDERIKSVATVLGLVCESMQIQLKGVEQTDDEAMRNTVRNKHIGVN